MEETGYALILLGAVCVVAALVGGNVSLPGGVKFAALASPRTRIPLGCFAAVLMLGGAVLIADRGNRSPPADESTASDVAEYSRTVSDICGRTMPGIADLRGLNDTSGKDEYAQSFWALASKLDELNGRLRSVPMPAAEKSSLSAMWDSHSAYVAAMDDVAAAISIEDDEAIESARIAASSAFDAFNQSARTYGLVKCVLR